MRRIISIIVASLLLCGIASIALVVGVAGATDGAAHATGKIEMAIKETNKIFFMAM